MLDEIRARFPQFGLAVYALEPGGPVTLEIQTPDGESFAFEGPTVAAVLERAFPAPAAEEAPATAAVPVAAEPAAGGEDIFG